MDAKEKKLRIQLVFAAVAGLFLFFSAATLSDSGKTADQYVYHDSVPLNEDYANSFILREKSGYIAVYTASQQDKPFFTTGIRVDRLRKADQSQLRSGIAIEGMQALQSILEDFGS